MNTTQFLDFGVKLCATVSEIYHSGTGSSKNNADSEILTNSFASSLDTISGDLAKYCAFLGNDAAVPIAATAPNQHQIGHVVEGCRGIAQDMLRRLEKLKAGKDSGRWKSFLVAVKSLWKAQEIIEIQHKLHLFRTELQWAIVVSLRSVPNVGPLSLYIGGN